MILDGINLDLQAGQTTDAARGVGVREDHAVPERGRSQRRLHREGAAGRQVLAPVPGAAPAKQRRRIQYVFQSPSSQPTSQHRRLAAGPAADDGRDVRAQRRAAVADALDAVRLGRSYIDRRPGELSGGERQRAAVARVLVNAPSLLVCDEMTSALDVSVQASVIELLRELQHERGLATPFVTNIALARHIDKLAALEKGQARGRRPHGRGAAPPGARLHQSTACATRPRWRTASHPTPVTRAGEVLTGFRRTAVRSSPHTLAPPRAAEPHVVGVMLLCRCTIRGPGTRSSALREHHRVASASTTSGLHLGAGCPRLPDQLPGVPWTRGAVRDRFQRHPVVAVRTARSSGRALGQQGVEQIDAAGPLQRREETDAHGDLR
ncbi:ATP-binding cassette domain-containing protein [Kocuria rhizophila]|nr:ATP-binding cassette domain-containing protein [Kocuria rhizophila]